MGHSKAKPKNKVEAWQLQGFKYFKVIRKLLTVLQDESPNPNRNLTYDAYVSLLLLYFFNPTLTSLRGIQQASTLAKVRKKLGVKSASLGSLSESSHVFDPELLAEVLQELSEQVDELPGRSKLKGLPKALTAVDGSFIRALPSMTWALWRRDDKNRAGLLHLQFEVLNWAVHAADVTHANFNEREVLRARLERGRLYVLDRGYAEYALFQAIIEAESSFIGRIRNDAVAKVLETRPLSPDAKGAGVVADEVVELGGWDTRDALKQPIRIVTVVAESVRRGVPRKVRLRLATDDLTLPAEVVALAYKNRWQVELFFRWLKAGIGCRHLIARSRNGVTIQVYVALIACMLLRLWTGRKPTKRTFEMFALYLQGWVEPDELAAHLNSLKKLESNA